MERYAVPVLLNSPTGGEVCGLGFRADGRRSKGEMQISGAHVALDEIHVFESRDRVVGEG
jgi:hypothetical protein